MKKGIRKYRLEIDKNFYDFINNEALPGTQIDKDFFWDNFSKLIYEFGPMNQQLVKKRDIIQQQLDTWYRESVIEDYDLEEYKKFLYDIGYLVEEGDNFFIDTTNVDTRGVHIDKNDIDKNGVDEINVHTNINDDNNITTTYDVFSVYCLCKSRASSINFSIFLNILKYVNC